VFAALTLPETFPAEKGACCGQTVTISCHYSDFQNDTRVVWFYHNNVSKGHLSNEGKPLAGLEHDKYDVADNGTWTTLFIHNLNLNDTAEYVCILPLEDNRHSTTLVTVIGNGLKMLISFQIRWICCTLLSLLRHEEGCKILW